VTSPGAWILSKCGDCESEIAGKVRSFVPSAALSIDDVIGFERDCEAETMWKCGNLQKNRVKTVI
jgi:hypothetical protein